MSLGDTFPATLRSAQVGEPRAIEALYRDTAPLVLGYLRAQRAVEPEDVASDVFVSMLGSIARFEGDEHQFRSWLLAITHRRMVDAVRRAGRRAEAPAPDDALLAEGEHRQAAEVEALVRLHTLGVLEAIDELTEDQRSVLLLRTVADLPIRDVSVVLGKPETAVKALLRRAVASVRRRVEDADEALEPVVCGADGP